MAISREQRSDHARALHAVPKMLLSLEPARKRFINLPAQTTSLIGRDGEIQRACELLLRPEVRLVTMTGTGGIGKTRLALACAEHLAQISREEVCFVSLAAVRDPDCVLPTLLQVLNIQEQNQLASLKHFLHKRSFLLVLDNFEQLLDAAPLLLDLLQSCPELKLLMTSRAVLHIPGEYVFPVRPLEIPPARCLNERELLANASIALFIERAAALKPGFALTAENAEALVSICRQLAGLPLALELAAARANLLTPQQLLERLTPCLDLLSRHGTVGPVRHQTIRRTIQWSYDLLNQREQQLLCRLSVFVDGCELADIEAFSRLLGDDPAWVLDGVSSLLDKSLLFQRESGGRTTRLDLLETMREFGKEMLIAHGQLEQVRAAHAAHYASFVPLPAPAQLGLAQGEWLARLTREYQNLLAALHFFQERQEHARAFRLAAGMGGIWFVNGYGSEGLVEMARALDLCQHSQESLPPELRSLVLALAAGIAIYHGDFHRARGWYGDCVHLCKQTGDSALLSLATAGITLVETDLGNYEAVATLLDEAIADVRQQGTPAVLPRLLVVAGQVCLHRGLSAQAQADAEASIQLARTMPAQEWSLACALSISGWVEYLKGSWTTAHAFGKESIAILRQLGFPVFSLEALCLFAHETAALGDVDAARSLFDEALTLSQDADDPAGIARALSGLGYLALRSAKLVEARHLFEESLTIIQPLKHLAARCAYIPASNLEGLAAIASSAGKASHAALLLGAAHALRRQYAYNNGLGREQLFWEQTRHMAEKTLGEGAFAVAFATGERLTPLQAVSAQEFDQPIRSAITANSGSMSGRLPFGQHLTKREMDVLRLLAQGLSNAQIAEKLTLSVVTINSYLRTIYGKLDVSSRTAAIRYIWDNHLL